MGDGSADLSVKPNTSGFWNIDYAANGFGTWDASYPGYGGAENIPVPAQLRRLARKRRTLPVMIVGSAITSPTTELATTGYTFQGA